jgi:hypothetical protein
MKHWQPTWTIFQKALPNGIYDIVLLLKRNRRNLGTQIPGHSDCNVTADMTFQGFCLGYLGDLSSLKNQVRAVRLTDLLKTERSMMLLKSTAAFTWFSSS